MSTAKAPLLWIAGDLRAKAQRLYGSCSLHHVIKACLADGSLAMVLYRMMQQAHRLRLGPITMLLNKLNLIICGCLIGRSADFGPRFVLIHAIGVVINSSVRGGSDIFIEHQVTIGAERDQSPTLGNNIFIGAGAKVLGAVTIGDEAKVGANAVVVKDVEPSTTVVGIPAKAVSKNNTSGAGKQFVQEEV